MTFTEAVRSVFQNYANFNGRAMRSEFWYWQLFTVLVNIVIGIFQAGTDAPTLGFAVGLVLLIPGLTVSVRRLHDTNRSGWHLLAFLIPVLGFLYLLYLFVRPGDISSNNYGAPPTVDAVRSR